MPSNQIFSLDTANETITRLEDSPFTVHAHQVILSRDGSKVYLFGGISSGRFSKRNYASYMYEIQSKEWF